MYVATLPLDADTYILNIAYVKIDAENVLM